VFLERCQSKSASLRREAMIKRMTREEKKKLYARARALIARSRGEKS